MQILLAVALEFKDLCLFCILLKIYENKFNELFYLHFIETGTFKFKTYNRRYIETLFWDKVLSKYH